MFTPAMTASSVSDPALSISMARVHARAPLPLAITMFLGPGCAPAEDAEDKAAALNIQSLLVMCRSPYGYCGNLDCKPQPGNRAISRGKCKSRRRFLQNFYNSPTTSVTWLLRIEIESFE